MAKPAGREPDISLVLSREVRIRPGEYARRVDVSKQQVYRWIYAGKLQATLIGRAWFIPVSELKEFFEREAA